jgi:hypothetical protein
MQLRFKAEDRISDFNVSMMVDCEEYKHVAAKKN